MLPLPFRWHQTAPANEFAHMGFNASDAYHFQSRFVNQLRRPIKGENLNRIREELYHFGKQFFFFKERLKTIYNVILSIFHIISHFLSPYLYLPS